MDTRKLNSGIVKVGIPLVLLMVLVIVGAGIYSTHQEKYNIQPIVGRWQETADTGGDGRLQILVFSDGVVAFSGESAWQCTGHADNGGVESYRVIYDCPKGKGYAAVNTNSDGSQLYFKDGELTRTLEIVSKVP